MTESEPASGKGRTRPEGKLDLDSVRVAIVASRFNAFVVDRLIQGARAALSEQGFAAGGGDLLHVPGAFELPLAVQVLAERREYDGVIALGAVIRGETAHFDYVCSECAAGLMRVSLDHNLPLGFGVLTVDTEAQAMARAGDQDNKGREAAEAVLEMIALVQRIGR